jgi:hypothetical protein
MKLWQIRDERGFGLALVPAHDEAEAMNIFLNWQLNGMVHWHGVPPTPREKLHAIQVDESDAAESAVRYQLRARRARC